MENNSNMDWKGYEEITKYIYETLGNQYGIKIKGYGKDCKVKGRSGVSHQIDVFTAQPHSSGTLLTAIECKFLKTKISKDTVMKLCEIMQDAGIDKGIIVSKEGFTRDTLTYAQHRNIELIQLREGDQQETETVHIFTVDFHINAILTQPKVTMIDFGKEQVTNESEIWGVYYSDILLHNSQKIPFKHYMSDFQNKLHQQSLLKTVTKTYDIKGKIVRMHREDIHFEQITFTGFLLEQDESSIKSFDFVDQVWMIMKSIFESTTFRITKSGIIIGEPPKK